MFNRVGGETPAAGMPGLARLRTSKLGAMVRAPSQATANDGDALLAAWEHCAEPTLLVGRDGRVARANPAIERRVGAEPGGLRGLPVSDIVDPATAATCERVLSRADGQGCIEQRGQLQAIQACEPCDVRIVPAGDDRGYPTHLVVAFVGAASTEDRSTLERTLASVARLAVEFAHDLNNELAVLINGTAMLQRRLADRPALVAHVHEVRSAAWRAARLSRMAGGLAPCHGHGESRVNLRQVVAEMVPMLELALMGARPLEVVIDDGLPAVTVPRGRLEHVLLGAARIGRQLGPEHGPLQVRVVARDDRSPLELRLGPVPSGAEPEYVDGPDSEGATLPRARETLARAQVTLDEEPLTGATCHLVLRIPRGLTS